MPYYEVQSFNAGMDVRKSAMTAPAGTLRLLKDAVVNPGGEIEKRQAFMLFDTAVAGSAGLMHKGDYLYTVTAGGASIAPTPTSVGNMALGGGFPAGVQVAALLDYAQFGNKLYTITQGTDGLVYHHYEGVYVPNGKGTSCVTFQRKMYCADGQYLRYSTVDKPDDWTTVGGGAGLTDLSMQDSEMLDTRALEVYYDRLAVFSQRACQVWVVDPDPNKNVLTQTLRQAGIVATRSARQYGSGDVLYLSQDGIRSLKTREASITASVSDIGSPMDGYVRDLFVSNTAAMNRAIALLEPANGRYWFVLDDRVLVLCNYPNPKISAWCVFFPNFTITDASTAGAFMFLRDSANRIWRYGAGLNTMVFDTSQAEVILPFLHFDKPATFKQFTAIDAACQNQWQVSLGLNPASETSEDALGTIDGPTFLTGQFPIMGHSTHCSLRFRTTQAARCVLSSVMIHYHETLTT